MHRKAHGLSHRRERSSTAHATRQCRRGRPAAFRRSVRALARMTRVRLSVFLSPVAKITVARPLHDGLRAHELYVGAKTLSERVVRAADQQETKLRLTQLLVELSVPASGDIHVIGILRLCADVVVDGITFGECGKRRCHVFSEMSGLCRAPPLLA